MKYLELLLEKLNGWMEPFPKGKARRKIFVVLVYLVFIVFMICLVMVKRAGH